MIWQMRHEDAALARRGRKRGVSLPFPTDAQGRHLLKVEMFRRDIGVVELAKAAGISHSTVSRALKDDRAKSEMQTRLFLACLAFPVDPGADALLKGELPWGEEEEA